MNFNKGGLSSNGLRIGDDGAFENVSSNRAEKRINYSRGYISFSPAFENTFCTIVSFITAQLLLYWVRR
jgi:hypothetical protein